MNSKNNRRPVRLLISLSALLIVSTAQAAPGGNPNSPLNDILAKLDALQADVSSLKADVATMKTNVASVKRDVTTCTLQAKQAGLCDHIISTKGQACFELAVVKAKMGAKWYGTVEAAAEGGVGWTSGPDGKIKLNLHAPVADIPSDFGVAIEPTLEVKGNVCFEIPIDAQRLASNAANALPESQAEALAAQFQQISASVIPLLAARMQTSMPTGEDTVRGIQAFDDLGNGYLMNPGGDLLSDGKLREAADIMPLPATIRTVLTDPGALSNRLPVLQGTLQERLATLCDSSHGLSVVRSPLFAGAGGDVCTYLNTVPAFDDIARQLLDIPAATSALVDGLLNKTQAVVKNTSNWFCSKPLFQNTALCK